MRGPPVNSFEFQPCGSTPRRNVIVLTPAQKGSIPLHLLHSFTAWTSRVSILFAPSLSRLSVSYVPKSRLRHPVFLQISAHFTATIGIRFPLLHQSPQFPCTSCLKKQGFHTKLARAAYAPFTPVSNSGQRSPLRITAAAGTVVSRGFLRIPSLVSSFRTGDLQYENLFSHAAPLLGQGFPIAQFPTAALP